MPSLAQNFSREDFKYINEPFTAEDLEYIEEQNIIFNKKFFKKEIF